MTAATSTTPYPEVPAAAIGAPVLIEADEPQSLFSDEAEASAGDRLLFDAADLALKDEPEQRFATCLDLVNALTAAPTVAARVTAPPPSETLSSAQQTTSTSAPGLTPLPPGTKPPKYKGPLRGLNPWVDCPAV